LDGLTPFTGAPAGPPPSRVGETAEVIE